MRMTQGYDIIADIHGHAGKLDELLTLMDYRKQRGVYQHPDGRQVIFVGDFIDRGPQIPETVAIARAMVESGTALATMGNHEYNAISYNLPKPGGDFARPHTLDNTVAHAETLKQYRSLYHRNAQDTWESDLDWFQSLPIYLSLDTLRITHAFWDARNIALVNQHFPDGRLSRTDILDIESNRHTPLSRAVTETLKGREFDLRQLGPDVGFVDQDGTHRTKTRLRWWHENESETVALEDILFDIPDHMKQQQHEWAVLRDTLTPDTDPRPLVFGHYWLQGKPHIQSATKACIDFSIAKHGVLTAYRFDGESHLSNEKLLWA